MTAMLILGGAILAWLVLSGKASQLAPRDWAMLGLLFVGLNLLRGGNIATAIPIIAVAGFGIARKFMQTGKGQEQAKPPPPQEQLFTDPAIIRARAVLEVGADADKETINAAWRKKLYDAHPDRGGDQAQAQEINQARDILLDQISAPKGQTDPKRDNRE